MVVGRSGSNWWRLGGGGEAKFLHSLEHTWHHSYVAGVAEFQPLKGGFSVYNSTDSVLAV